jgi:hypothetical protein
MDMEGVFKMKIWLPLLALMIFGSMYNGAAKDVQVEGTAVNEFQRIGAWGWIVDVSRVIDGPAEMQGMQISVYLTSANPAEYPPGFLDSNIIAGGRVEAFGQLESSDSGEIFGIVLTGSADYYLKSIAGS